MAEQEEARPSSFCSLEERNFGIWQKATAQTEQTLCSAQQPLPCQSKRCCPPAPAGTSSIRIHQAAPRPPVPPGAARSPVLCPTALGSTTSPCLPAAPSSLCIKARPHGAGRAQRDVGLCETSPGFLSGCERVKATASIKGSSGAEGVEKVRWVGVAQTPWNLRNFPLLSHFPYSSRGKEQNGTPGLQYEWGWAHPSPWGAQGRGLWLQQGLLRALAPCRTQPPPKGHTGHHLSPAGLCHLHHHHSQPELHKRVLLQRC